MLWNSEVKWGKGVALFSTVFMCWAKATLCYAKYSKGSVKWCSVLFSKGGALGSRERQRIGYVGRGLGKAKRGK